MRQGVERRRDAFVCLLRYLAQDTEQAGLDVDLDRIAYLREYLDRRNQTHHLEVFIAARAWRGELGRPAEGQAGPYGHRITAVRWVPRDELPGIRVFPEVLKDEFWSDRQRGFEGIRYLGTKED